MNPSMTSRRPRWAPILVVVAVAAATIVAVPSVREPVLRAAGWALIVNEPVAPADIIVIVPGIGGAGALEAADLVQSGIATRVAVFADPPSGEDHEFIRRGLPYEDAAARQIDQLKWLGVTDIAQIPRADTEARCCQDARGSSPVSAILNDFYGGCFEPAKPRAAVLLSICLDLFSREFWRIAVLDQTWPPPNLLNPPRPPAMTESEA
jgi:hypothetical protein